MAKTRDPLARLLQIKQAKQRYDSLAKSRDDLIREAVEQGHSERTVALAIGLSPGRINRIVHRTR
jgi:hypothetical protein